MNDRTRLKRNPAISNDGQSANRRRTALKRIESAMVRISILYPNAEGARFDLRYYVETHMPMSVRLLSAHRGFRGVSVEEGLGGAAPGTPPTFIAMCHFLFLSVEDFLAAFQPHAEVLQGDMPNYTDIEPVIQFNEVLITQ